MSGGSSYQGLEAIIERLGAGKEDLQRELADRLERNLALVRGLVESSPAMPPGIKRRMADRVAVLGIVQDILDSRSLAAERRVTELCKGLSAWFGVTRADSRDVRVGASSVGPALPVSELRDLGLILGEFLQNSWDHAFPEGGRGSIRIRLDSRPEGGFVLDYEDSGTGLPEGVDAARGGGGGLFLVRALAAERGASLELREAGHWILDAPAPRPRDRS